MESFAWAECLDQCLTGNDSIAKATNQARLPVQDALPEASPPLPADDHVKTDPGSDPDSADRKVSPSPSPQQDTLQQSQLQQPAAMQWVETDDLGASKRNLPADGKQTMPNGVLQQPQGSMQQPPGSAQQPQGSMQQPQRSAQQPQGSVQQPQGSMQQSQGMLQQPQGIVQRVRGSSQAAEGQSDLQGVAEQANPSNQSGALVKQELPDLSVVRPARRRQDSLTPACVATTARSGNSYRLTLINQCDIFACSIPDTACCFASKFILPRLVPCPTTEGHSLHKVASHESFGLRGLLFLTRFIE